MTKQNRIALGMLAACSIGVGACLDPQVSDDVVLSGLILPAGSDVPSAHDDPVLEQQIADNDGVDGTVPLLSAFADGLPVRYWDLGSSPSFGAPLFALVRIDENDEPIFLAHNTIVDAIPGDSGYSPYWTLYLLEVTDLYDGELITSFAAVEEAQQLGLVLAPRQPTIAINCPAVATDVRLEVGDGEDPLPPSNLFYWQGKTVRNYDLGLMPIPDSNTEPEPEVLVISREGKEPLSEPLRQVDITNDGDIVDTNNVFEREPSDARYSPLTRRVNVTVPDDGFPLIDITQNQEASGVKQFSDLFAPEPRPGRVVSFEKTEDLRNLPQQSAPGGL